MAQTKPSKEQQKIEQVKLPEKKKGLPILPILGGVVLLLLVGGFLWINSMNDSLTESEMGIPKEGIDVLEAPLSASIGNTITIKWRVLGVTADSSEVVYSNNARGGFGSDFDTSSLTVEGSTYEDLARGTSTQSDFGGQIFATTVKVEYLPIFMRIHAVGNNKNYWTNEIVVVEE